MIDNIFDTPVPEGTSFVRRLRMIFGKIELNPKENQSKCVSDFI